MKMPKSSKVKTNKMLNNEIKNTKRPDLDNIIKFFLDSMNGLVFTDDSLIWKLKAQKVYSLDPRTEIIIKTN